MRNWEHTANRELMLQKKTMNRYIKLVGIIKETSPQLFDMKIAYSYKIEVADSESDFGCLQ